MSRKEFYRELRYILNNDEDWAEVKVAAIQALMMVYKYERAKSTGSNTKLAKDK